MTIGVSCPAFSADPVEDWASPVFEEFDHWEIFSEACHSFLYCLGELEEVLPSYDMTYSVHTPICDVNIAAVSECIREASLNEVVRTAELASELEITMFTVHPGLFSLSVPGMEARSLEIARESMRFLDRAAAEYGVTFAVENMPRMPFFIGRTAEQLSSLIEGTDLSVCFDIGHANTTGQIDAMLDAFGDRIANVHIHDNDGSSDAHMTIGDGNIDFRHVLGRLSSYRGDLIIESKGFDSAVESRLRLESMSS